MSNYPKSMSHQRNNSRPMRRSAAVARLRIIDNIKSDNANSDEDSLVNPQIDSTLDNTLDSDCSQYTNEGSHNVIRYLIDQCDRALFEDERTQIIEKIFEFLNKNPTALVYSSALRLSVLKKMKELEIHLTTRNDNFHAAKYEEAIKMMKLSMRAHIRNSITRKTIYKSLDDITTSLKDYAIWSPGLPLMTQIRELYKTLESIKNHPCYVSDMLII